MNSKQIMRYNEILFFIRSFEGVTNDNCPNLESLRDGYIFATLYNQMTNPSNMFDTSLLRITEEGDWVYCILNLAKLCNHIKPEFESLNIYCHFDLYKIAKKGDLDQICAFIKMLVKYLMNGPKKEVMKHKFLSLPVKTQLSIVVGV